MHRRHACEPLRASAGLLALAMATGCSTTAPPSDAATDLGPPDTADSNPTDATTDLATDTFSSTDIPADAPADAPTDIPTDIPTDPLPPGPPPASGSAIRHVVVIEQENHTFDNYFGRYCTALAGSSPVCTSGPGCCEAAPAMDPSGSPPSALTDAANGSYSPDHSQACEAAEIHGGAMDRFVTGTACADPRNFAVADAALMATYHGYARRYALADRYFQPIVGASLSNTIYFAVAREKFIDNTLGPRTVGSHCLGYTDTVAYTDTTLADVLLDGGFTFGTYAEGYDLARAADPHCPAAPAECRLHIGYYPCVYDPGDTPFNFFQRFADSGIHTLDYQRLVSDIAAQRLPSLAFVRAYGFRSEHPGGGSRISDGEAWTDDLVQRILTSPYAMDTLIVLTWDEGGGYYDHVTPPGVNPVDGQAPGTRVPMLVLGRFARANTVSHVVMDHASVVRFIEWNFTGTTGQLHARDATASNLGSMIDPTAAGVPVP